MFKDLFEAEILKQADIRCVSFSPLTFTNAETDEEQTVDQWVANGCVYNELEQWDNKHYVFQTSLLKVEVGPYKGPWTEHPEITVYFRKSDNGLAFIVDNCGSVMSARCFVERVCAYTAAL